MFDPASYTNLAQIEKMIRPGFLAGSMQDRTSLLVSSGGTVDGTCSEVDEFVPRRIVLFGRQYHRQFHGSAVPGLKYGSVIMYTVGRQS